MPETGREWSAFNRSYANKTSDMKKGEERRIIISTEDYVYLVCADGYMHGYIADKIYILGNEEYLRSIREEFINGGTDPRGKTLNSDAQDEWNGSRRGYGDLSVSERKERTVGIDLLDEDESKGNIVGYRWESDGDFGAEEELENGGLGTMYFDGENAYELTERGWVRIPLD